MSTKEERARMRELMRKATPYVFSLWCLNSTDRDGIQESVDALNEMLDDAYSNANALSNVELMGLLRTTFSVRNYLVSWQPLLQVAMVVVADRGRDVDDLFHGLRPGDYGV